MQVSVKTAIIMYLVGAIASIMAWHSKMVLIIGFVSLSITSIVLTIMGE